MSEIPKTSRCAFVVIKIRVKDEDYLLMRRDPSWKDINFIGGHDVPKDHGRFERTAKRELLEEVPALRIFTSFRLRSLTDQVSHGPIFSLSAQRPMKYILKFFLLEFTKKPSSFFQEFGDRTQNIFVSTRMITAQAYRMSGLVEVLEGTLSGGLGAIPYSWPDDLWETVRESKLFQRNQLDLTFT